MKFNLRLKLWNSIHESIFQYKHTVGDILKQKII